MQARDIIERMVEGLKAARYDINRLITDGEHVLGLMSSGEDTPEPGRVIDPLDAPEVTGRDKDGEFDLEAKQRHDRIHLDE